MIRPGNVRIKLVEMLTSFCVKGLFLVKSFFNSFLNSFSTVFLTVFTELVYFIRNSIFADASIAKAIKLHVKDCMGILTQYGRHGRKAGVFCMTRFSRLSTLLFVSTLLLQLPVTFFTHYFLDVHVLFLSFFFRDPF